MIPATATGAQDVLRTVTALTSSVSISRATWRIVWVSEATIAGAFTRSPACR